MDFTIDALREDDWPQERSIYLEGIATGQATFETDAPDWEQWDSNHLAQCRLVARFEGRVLGWAALSPVSRRTVYSGVVDESIYVAAAARGKGVGRALLGTLVKDSEEAGIWSIQAGIFRENQASVALHRRCGFREIGYQKSKGCLHGVWHDVILMERRSETVGV